jgi:hypothetical protein
MQCATGFSVRFRIGRGKRVCQDSRVRLPLQDLIMLTVGSFMIISTPHKPPTYSVDESFSSQKNPLSDEWS